VCPSFFSWAEVLFQSCGALVFPLGTQDHGGLAPTTPAHGAGRRPNFGVDVDRDHGEYNGRPMAVTRSHQRSPSLPFLDFDTVALLFLFDKHCLIME
jgi:hypothetical protein